MRESGGSDRYGAGHSAITDRVTAVSTHPSSARATRRGHGTLTTRAAGTAARIACSYAPDRIVPAGPITPILSLCGSEAGRRPRDREPARREGPSPVRGGRSILPLPNRTPRPADPHPPLIL